MKTLIKEWFEKWEEGDFEALPITESFIHKSPFGIIQGKEEYLSLVRNNKDKFLGYTFKLEDVLFDHSRACVKYTARQGSDFELEVSEWHFSKDGLIQEVHAYYHIGEIAVDRQIKEY